MYLSQTNGPGYCRLVGSLGRVSRSLNTNPWTPQYGLDLIFEGDFSFGRNPSFISDPIPISSILGISEFPGEKTAEPDLFKFEKPLYRAWSRDVDWDRYGTILDLVNQINNVPQNSDFPRENEVYHRHFTGTLGDIDIPYFDYHTGNQNGVYYNFVPIFDVLDNTPYREFRATDINSDGFLSFEFRDAQLNPFGPNQPPSVDYWHYIQTVAAKYKELGFVAADPYTGSWPFRDIWPDNHWLLVFDNMSNNSIRSYNRWHILLEYDYELKYHSGADVWKTKYHVKMDVLAYFEPVFGSNNPFDWNEIGDVFKVVDSSTVSVVESTLYYDNGTGSHLYSRYPVDEVIPPVVIDTDWGTRFQPTYKVRLFSQPVQSLVGARSRFYALRCFKSASHGVNTYHEALTQRFGLFEQDFRASSFYSSSEALHNAIDVLQSNNIENATQLSGLVDLLPDLKGVGAIAAKAAKRDPGAVLDTVDFLADAVLAFRFGQKPTAGDVNEFISTDFQSTFNSLLRSKSQTVYGSSTYWFTPDEMSSLIQLPGTMKLVTRSKIRIHTDMTTLLTGYLTANGMGVMPTLSRLWAVVPFSFVVDWFTGIGNRLQSIDDQLTWMAMGTDWCLHSFKLVYYPSDAVLADYGLYSDSDDPFGFVIYSREFSRLMPRLKDARFDYQAPTHGPNPVTVGALVWQFL